MSISAILILLQLVAAMLSNPALANNSSTQDLANQAVALATQALSQIAETANTTPTSSAPVVQATPTSSTTVTSTPETTLGSIRLVGTNDNSDQLSTRVRASLYVLLFDKNGNPITNASATIATDDPLPSGVGYGNYAGAEFETNNASLGQTIFTISNPAYHGNYIFTYTPQTDGPHTITVTALGTSKSVTVQSVTTSQTPAPATCTLSVAVNGKKATMTWNSSNISRDNKQLERIGSIFFEYPATSGQRMWSEQIFTVVANSTGTFSGVEDGKGMGLEPETLGITGGLENATNFKLVFPDGTTCYSSATQ